MSDFKTNEYADLIGGSEFEPHESNPMLGFRGASRYYSDRYKEGFALECQAIRRVRDDIGLDNVLIMIPFCRTTDEADKVIDVLEENGLKRGEKGLEIYVMCEIPSNVTLADQFAERFDGFSIGSNDLTQLVLGVDRDSSLLAHIFDERNEAVKRQVRSVIEVAHRYDCKVGICGQAPSDYPEFAAFLVEAGIDSISLNPDSVIETKKRIAKTEEEVAEKG
jgi:pyruvate,water dikinase